MKARELFLEVVRLLESQYNGRFYFNSHDPIHLYNKNPSDFNLIDDDSLPNLFLGSEDANSFTSHDDVYCAIQAISSSIRNEYRKNIHKGKSNHTVNSYIYQVPSPFKVLDFNNSREVEKAYNDHAIVDIPKLLNRHIVNIDFSFINYSVFKTLYDGIKIGETVYLILGNQEIKTFLDKIRLVDGNAIRFATGTKENITIPKEIIDELKNYTFNFDYTLPNSVYTWYHSQFPSNSPLILYRGVGISGKTLINQDINSKEEFDKFLYSFLGINSLSDLRAGNNVTFSHHKQMSFSTRPEIAKSFSDGQDAKNINLLIKSEVPYSQVVFDFNKLPTSILKKEFKYYLENEVIVQGTVHGVISNVWYRDTLPKARSSFSSFLGRLGYLYKKSGFVEKI